MERLVLIFAYHFPPENSSGAARPHRFYKYLSQLGYKCRVFTASDQLGGKDPNIEYVPDPFVTRSGRNLGWQIERAMRKIVLPGEVGMQWAYHAARAGRAYIRAHRGASVTIFSSFPPLGAHLAGWQLAYPNETRWIADFRDPPVAASVAGKGNRFREQAYRWLEHDVARRADAIIANTDEAMEEWLEKFPSLNGKVHLIWNGFDPDNRVSALPVSTGDCRVLSHIGDLYGGRTAMPILESIARLIEAGRLSPGSIRVQLVGATVPSAIPNPEFLDRAKGWLDVVTERIPQCEARQIASSSGGLMLLQPQSATQVPAKLFEYLQIGRPILAYVQANSPVERLLDQSGVPFRCVYPGSTHESLDSVVADFFSLPQSVVLANSWFQEQFNAKNQTLTLDAIIRALHDEPAREMEPQNGPQNVAEHSTISTVQPAARNPHESRIECSNRT